MENPPQDPHHPQPAEPVVVARILRPHGVDGSLSILLLSDVPSRFDPGRSISAGNRSFTIASFRPTGADSALIQLEGISTRRQAASIADKFLYALPDAEAELEEGEYFHYQLIGMKVQTEEGEELGEIQEILETGSNDVYIIRGHSGELLIPATSQVVRQVDVNGNLMLVQLPEGLR